MRRGVSFPGHPTRERDTSKGATPSRASNHHMTRAPENEMRRESPQASVKTSRRPPVSRRLGFPGIATTSWRQANVVLSHRADIFRHFPQLRFTDRSATAREGHDSQGPTTPHYLDNTCNTTECCWSCRWSNQHKPEPQCASPVVLGVLQQSMPHRGRPQQ